MALAGLIRLSHLHPRADAKPPATERGARPADESEALSAGKAPRPLVRVLVGVATLLLVGLYAYVLFESASQVDWQRQLGTFMPTWPFW